MKKINIELIRGDAHSLVLNFKQEGQPVNITGWKIYFTLKQNETDSDENAVFKKDIVVESGSEGQAILDLLPQETESIPPSVYLYDIQVKTTEGLIYTAIMGQCRVIADITQRRS